MVTRLLGFLSGTNSSEGLRGTRNSAEALRARIRATYMGSTIPHLHAHWVLIAIVCGVFYLIFDALRSFALQLSPVRLRALSTDAEEGSSRWSEFAVEDFQLFVTVTEE